MKTNYRCEVCDTNYLDEVELRYIVKNFVDRNRKDFRIVCKLCCKSGWSIQGDTPAFIDEKCRTEALRRLPGNNRTEMMRRHIKNPKRRFII